MTAEELLAYLTENEFNKIPKSQVIPVLESTIAALNRLREIAQAARGHTYHNRRLEAAYLNLQPGDVELKPR